MVWTCIYFGQFFQGYLLGNVTVWTALCQYFLEDTTIARDKIRGTTVDDVQSLWQMKQVSDLVLTVVSDLVWQMKQVSDLYVWTLAGLCEKWRPVT